MPFLRTAAPAQRPPPGVAADPPAAVLARRLRAQRLTLLQVPEPALAGPWLRAQLLPLLGRRARDLAGVEPLPPSATGPDLERRSGDGASGETAALFADWRSAQREGVLHWAGAASGDRMLLVLDGFDDCLHAAVDQRAALDFVDDLLVASRRDGQPLHLLLLLSGPACPSLDLLRHRGVDVDAALLVLDLPLQAAAPRRPAAAPAGRARRSVWARLGLAGAMLVLGGLLAIGQAPPPPAAGSGALSALAPAADAAPPQAAPGALRR